VAEAPQSLEREKSGRRSVEEEKGTVEKLQSRIVELPFERRYHESNEDQPMG
jgi:hypothetical protein